MFHITDAQLFCAFEKKLTEEIILKDAESSVRSKAEASYHV